MGRGENNEMNQTGATLRARPLTPEDLSERAEEILETLAREQAPQLVSSGGEISAILIPVGESNLEAAIRSVDPRLLASRETARGAERSELADLLPEDAPKPPAEFYEHSRFPYTYAADAVRMLSGKEDNGITPNLSRADASHLIHSIAQALALDPEELAGRIAVRYYELVS